MCNGITYFCIQDLWQSHFGGSSNPPTPPQNFLMAPSYLPSAVLTSRGVFHEGNPRD